MIHTVVVDLAIGGGGERFTFNSGCQLGGDGSWVMGYSGGWEQGGGLRWG